MKITFMGAGSTIFARNVIGDCMCSESLRESEFALYDIDGERLKESEMILSAMNRTFGNKGKITTYLGAENRKEALRGATFVVNAIQVGGYDPCTITDFEMSCFSYRFRPAVRYAKSLIEQGVLGQIVNVSVEYLKDSAFWKNRPMEWRFEKEKAGTGVLGDLGVHLIDMTRLLVDDFDSLTGHAEIIVKERPWADGSGVGQVETDDFCTFIARMKNGATANFTISRCALGEKNSIRYDVYGTKGVISFDLNNPNVLGVCTIDDDPKLAEINKVNVPKEYHVTQEQSFVDAILGNKVAYFPDIYEAIECQKILDALQESSERKIWVKVH